VIEGATPKSMSATHASRRLSSFGGDEKEVPRKRKKAAVTLLEKLAKHLGHDEAGRVAAEDLVGFKESLVKAVKRGELDPAHSSEPD
jgi:hypothetical protein